MDRPWANPNPLSTSTVAQLLDRLLPELKASQLDELGAGWDFCTFLATTADGQRWVIRIPKRPGEVSRLAREQRLLQRLHEQLDALQDGAHYRTRMPAYRQVLYDNTAPALALAVYPLLPGRTLTQQPTTPHAEAIGTALGQWLAIIHKLTPEPPPAKLPHRFNADLVEHRQALRELRGLLPTALEQALDQLLRQAVNARTAFDGALQLTDGERRCCFIHDDLGPEHILVNGPEISGLIDWTDAGWGGPLTDFVGLWAWGGDAAARAAFSAYNARPTESQWSELRLRGTCYALGLAHFGQFAPDSRAWHDGVQMLHRMLQAGQLPAPPPDSSADHR